MKTHDSIYFDGRHYDALFPGLQRQEEIAFYRRCSEAFGEPVLELGCGTGRLTIPLAEAGVQVTGLDLSLPMLACARQKAAETRVAVEWVQADCRTFDLGKRFGLIFFPANALQHLLDWPSLEACLRQVKHHLQENGGFVFEIFNPALSLLTRDPTQQYPVGQYADPDGDGSVEITENNIYDTATQINHIRWHYRRSGQAEPTVTELNLRMYYPQEIDALLHYNGFAVTAKYGDYAETPFTASSPRQLIVCQPQ